MAKRRMVIMGAGALIACGIILVVIVLPGKHGAVPVEPTVVPQPPESAESAAPLPPVVPLPPARGSEPPATTVAEEEPAEEARAATPSAPAVPPVVSPVQTVERPSYSASRIAAAGKEPKLVLSPPHREALIPVLSPYRGSKITILVESGDTADVQFAEQLKDAFMKSGWGVNGVEEGVPSGPTPRIYLLVPDDAARGRVEAVVKGMEILGTCCPVARVSYLDKDELELRVGNRP